MTTQTSPWPTDLDRLVKQCKYKEGWRFRLIHDYDRGQESHGTTLEIVIKCVDTYDTDEDILIRHRHIVPAASYNERSWRRWLFDRILDVEKHEAMEFFQIDGKRPYAPNHGPGHDPYTIFEEGTLQEKRTSSAGEERDTDAPQESDVSFRLRLLWVVSSTDKAFTEIAVGPELDALGRKYDMIRRRS